MYKIGLDTFERLKDEYFEYTFWDDTSVLKVKWKISCDRKYGSSNVCIISVMNKN